MRHPIERLVSAYRDRIAGLKASYAQYAAMARTLKLRRRDAGLEGRYKPRRGRKGAKEVVTRRPISVPTWPEFVKFILVLPTVKDVSSLQTYNKEATRISAYLISTPLLVTCAGPSLGGVHAALQPLPLQLHLHRAPGGQVSSDWWRAVRAEL